MEWFWGKARLASKKSEKVKFKWVDGDGKDKSIFFWTSYFSWWLTKDVSLMVVDFCRKRWDWCNAALGKSNIRP
jgi:hypothetical protein